MNDLDQRTFAQEVAEGASVSVARANLLFAREIAYPQLRPAAALAELEDLAEAAGRAVGGETDPAARALALAEYLFRGLDFRGNAAAYSDVRNSYLNEVLARRVGIPISLSALYLHIGEQLELPVAGVGLPGHFIVRVQTGEAHIFLDPFNRGATLGPEDCLHLVRAATGYKGKFDRRWLTPTPPRAIVARMLNNLRHAYVQAEAWPTAIRVLERLRWLQPEEPAHLRDLGMVFFRDGALRRAAELLNEYLVLAPQAEDADAVRQSRDLLWDEVARLN